MCCKAVSPVPRHSPSNDKSTHKSARTSAPVSGAPPSIARGCSSIKFGASPVLPHSLILVHASLEHHTSPAGASCTRPVAVVLRRLRRCARLVPEQRSKPMKTGCLIRLEFVVDSRLPLAVPRGIRRTLNADSSSRRRVTRSPALLALSSPPVALTLAATRRMFYVMYA